METHRQEIKKINRVFGPLLEMNASWTGRCRLNATQICFQIISQDKISILSSYEEEKVEKSGSASLMSCLVFMEKISRLVYYDILIGGSAGLTLLAIWRYLSIGARPISGVLIMNDAKEASI